MIRYLSFSICGLVAFAALGVPVAADEVRDKPKAVVELFTSQGCSSCPPADALLTSLSESPDVVALAYHVDYWDYVGWKDTLGHSSYSDRQRAYAESWGSSRIYTPQMVVNGAKAVVGSRRYDVHQAVDQASLPLSVHLVRDGGMLKVTIPANTSLDDATVWLVTYLGRTEVEIDRGDNAGKSIAYTQVVTGRQVLGMWEGATGANLKLPISEILDGADTGIAVIVQQERQGLPGPILGAAAYEQ